MLLESGAKVHATNSVGRTPSQMAAFVGKCSHIMYMFLTKSCTFTINLVYVSGNHACVAVINNFIPKSDIDYYTVPTGFETEPKLPPQLSHPLHRFVMQVSKIPTNSCDGSLFLFIPNVC